MEHIRIHKVNAYRRQELKRIIEAKQKDELEMAQQLLADFGSNTVFMGYLRALVANAMDDIRWLIMHGRGEDAFKEALKKDAINDQWVRKKYGIHEPDVADSKERGRQLEKKWGSFFRFLTDRQSANIFSLSPSQCADLIRFYGEVIEAFDKLSPREVMFRNFLVKVKKIADSLVKRSKEYQIQQGHKGGEGLQWQKPKTMSEPGQRGRIFGAIGMKNGKWSDNLQASDLKPPKPTDNDYQKNLQNYNWMKALVDEFLKRRTKTELRIARMRGGISLWVQTKVDRIAKIDKVFGLSHGATISGTTTDNIFFFNRFSLVDRYLGEDVTVMDDRLDKFLLQHYFYAGGPMGVKYGESPTRTIPVFKRNTIIDPILYILPLGAIVGEGHHSTIECALPLVLNGIVKYTIGDYESLFPVDRGRRNACGPMSNVKNTLAKYEARDYDRKIVIYYNSSHDYEGYFKFNPRKDPQWAEIAKVNQAMSDKFAGFAQYPTKEDVGKLHESIRKEINAKWRCANCRKTYSTKWKPVKCDSCFGRIEEA
jgi:hypothetical protein